MKRIILIQNNVIAGIVSIMALSTGFYEAGGLKAVLIALMGFLIMRQGLLELERLYLRRVFSDDGNGKRESQHNTVPGIPWFKMRFSEIKQRNRNISGNIKTIQTATRKNTAR